MFKYLLFFIFLPFVLLAQPQRHCGTTIQSAGQLGHPAVEAFIAQKIKDFRKRRITETESTYRIPVIVHVVHNGEPVGEGANISAEQVYSQIEVLNEDFNRQNADADQTRSQFVDVAASLAIEFAPATVAPDGTPLDEPGIHRVNGGQAIWTEPQAKTNLMPETIWEPLLYLNIWSLNLPGGELGYAQFPSFDGLEGLEVTDNAEFDGVLVDYTNFGSIEKVNTPQLQEGAPYNLGRTLTHELGHTFGLIHIWGDGGCGVDDFCEDTPLSGRPIYNCDTEVSSCESVDMYENFMDYTTDACMNMFTQDQVERMIVVLENAVRRVSLLSSTTANPITEGVFAGFTADKTTVCAGGGISFSDDSRAFNGTPVQVFEWTFEGGDPPAASDAFPFVTYNTPGTYDVSLYVEDFLDNNAITITDYVTVVDTSAAQAMPFAEDFENGFENNDWSQSETNGWEILNVDGNEGRQATGVKNAIFDYRTREVELYSPLLRVPDTEFIAISFDLAYATRNNINNEALIVLLSDDCGGTAQEAWRKSGANLATTTSTGSFVPSAPEDWRRETIIISRENLNSDILRLIFKVEGNRGNNLYLDNLSVDAVEVQAPLADFAADYTYLLAGEVVQFRNQSQNTPTEFRWTFTGGTPAESSQENPVVSYSSPGTYDVSLIVSNVVGRNTATKPAYIEVVSGKKIDRIGAGTLQTLREDGERVSGHNAAQDEAKAEFFDGLESYESLVGADIFFGDLDIAEAGGSVELAVWTVSETTGAPRDLLATQNIPFEQIERDVAAARFSRVILDQPLEVPPTQLFVGVRFDYETENKVAIQTVTSRPNTGWELTADGAWLPYDDSRGLSLAHAIYPLFSPEDPVVSGLEENPVSQQISIFPNPSSKRVFWAVSGALRIYHVELTNIQGQVVRTFPTRYNEGSLENLSKGLYFMHFTTDQGIGVRRLMVR